VVTVSHCVTVLDPYPQAHVHTGWRDQTGFNFLSFSLPPTRAQAFKIGTLVLLH
jgi:hypothetical protein